MRKTFSLLLAFSLVAGIGLGQTPDDAPVNGEQGPSITDLPGQASQVAQQVVSNIQNRFQEGVQNMGEALGDSLREMLGNGQARNITETGGR